MSSAYSKVILFGQPGVFRATDYGFPLHTLEEIKADFPDVEVIWRGTHQRHEVWACGQQGELFCMDNNLERWQWPKLLDQIRENRAAALSYKAGDAGRRIRERMAAEEADRVDAAVNRMDPEREARDLLQHFGGRVAPIAVPESLPAL